MNNRNFLLLVFVFALFFFARTQASTEIDSVQVLINTYSGSEIHFLVYVSDPFDEYLAFDRIEEEEYSFKLRKASDQAIIDEGNSSEIAVGGHGQKIHFIVSLNRELGHLIAGKRISVYIDLNKDLIFERSADNPPFVLTRGEIKQLSNEAFLLSDEQRALLIDAAGNQVYLNTNHFDIAKQVDEADSVAAEYVVNFDYYKKLPLSIGKAGTLLLHCKGILSTEKENPLNIAESYTIWRVPGSDHFQVEIGAAGNQELTSGSLRANLCWQGLIPNLIDLTNGSPRLRLKPYLKGGVTFVRNLDDQNPFEDKESHLQFFAEGYYYIPVAQKFAMILEGDVVYSESFTVREKWRTFYSISFGYDLPLQDLKLMFKIQNGENEINIGRTKRVLLGFLLDYIPF